MKHCRNNVYSEKKKRSQTYTLANSLFLFLLRDMTNSYINVRKFSVEFAKYICDFSWAEARINKIKMSLFWKTARALGKNIGNHLCLLFQTNKTANDQYLINWNGVHSNKFKMTLIYLLMTANLVCSGSTRKRKYYYVIITTIYPTLPKISIYSLEID